MGWGKITAHSVIVSFQHFPIRRSFSCSAAKQMKPTTNIISEYAKSGRSSCKKCSNIIPINTLRLGLVTRDPKGFTMTKWHHSYCLLPGSKFLSFPDSIIGFSELKASDKEEIKRLMDGNLLEEFEVCQVEEAEIHSKNIEKKMVEGVNALDEALAVSCGTEVCQVQQFQEEEDENSKMIKFSVEKKAKIDCSISKFDNYKGATIPPNWNAFRTVIFLEKGDGLRSSKKIAAFDFDGCLAKTSVGKIGADAWSLMYDSIPNKLKRLYNEDYKLVIFTNESNIDRWKNQRQRAVDSKIGRLNNFISLVNLPIQVFIACGVSKSKSQEKDSFRKPEPGMWQFMEQLNSGIQIDMDESFYVGDAAGRPNDHSDADIKFAEAVGLKFFVPEDYFG